MGLLERIGIKQKAYIPQLGDINSVTPETYTSKASQLKANINAVASANDIIAETCSSLELQLYKIQKDGKKERVMTHDILDLLNNPNAYMSGEQMRQLHHTYMNLIGESYILKQGEGKIPDSLIILPAQSVDFKVNEDYTQSTITFNSKKYSIEEVIRGLNPDPEDPFSGRSVIKASAQTIASDTSAKRWNNKFYENSARPNVVIEVPDTMSDTTYKRFKQEFNENFVGTDNNGKPLIIEEGAKISPFMVNQKEMDWLASQQFTRTEILSMFRVPSALLGEVADSNRSNTEAVEYIFGKYTIKPQMEAFVDIMNRSLVKPYDPTLELSFESPVPKDVLAEVEALQAGVDKWLTIDEAREQVGMKPLTNGSGDVLYRPFSEVALGTNVYAGTDAEKALKAEVNKSKNTRELLKKANSVIKKQQKKIGKEQGTYKSAEQRTAIGERKVALTEQNVKYFETEFQIASRNHFDEQRLLMMKALNTLELEQMKTYKKKSILEDLMLGWAVTTGDYQKVLVVLYGQLMKVQGDSAMGLISSPVDFDFNDPAVVKFYQSRSELISQIVDDETEKQLRATLTEGLTAGENTKELAARMENVFGSASDYRAKRIARTESIRTANQADIEAWVQSGYVTGKEFYTAKDQRVCAFCMEMDGKVVDLESNYYSKGDEMTATVEQKDGTYTEQVMKFDFESISGPPLHPNCRCGLIPITREI